MLTKFVIFAILVHQINGGLVANQFKSGVKNYFKNGKNFTSEFNRFLTTIDLRHSFRTGAEEYIDSSVICDACDGLLDSIIEEVHNGLNMQDVIDLAITLCIDLNIEPEPVCRGAVNLNAGIIMYIIENRPELRANRICGIVAQSFGCGGSVGEWSIDIAPGSQDFVKGVVTDSTPLKVLQVTDFHYDPMYTPGSLAACAAPLCCQSDSGVASTPEEGAGYWGDYRSCDTPWYGVEDALDHIAETHPDIDYVYYTGDTISHRIWDTSISGNTEDITLLYNTLLAKFPNTPVYPIFGNHEAHPVDIFTPPEIEEEEFSTAWLFDLAADLWGSILGEGTAETIRRGGFYTVLIRPGFRLIALNSNVGYTFNWWLLYDDVDPFGQLQWLADTLYQAEQDGEIVHIISHVPSSDDTCYKTWSQQYRRILERFAGTIAAAFNGHSHTDEFIVYHSSEEPTKAINVAYNGGSVTTFSNNNRNYKIYHVDQQNYEVHDYDCWSYNMTEANLTPNQRPNWFKLYSFKDAYGLSGASPSDLRDLTFRMVENETLRQKYWEFRSRRADTALEGGCSDECHKGNICDILASSFGDTTQCDEVMAGWQ
ncbi:sphingomyelin phosphodiesterase-like isoform X3 [Onthophagus taurus]|uniref:sphingomyelin phosphodiesterase-like isoform X3 n=1 Tax=Onthophagus taurus TaxID=166361 RepID=UPI0039BE4C4A